MTESNRSTALSTEAPETGTERGGKAVAKADALERDLLALAKTPEERARAYEAASAFRRSQMIRQAAVSIAGTGWGKDLSEVARAYVARYALELGTDPVRHWEILGGKLYDRAELWLDLCAAQADYDGEIHEYINDDERLNQEERERRKQLRAKHNTPEDSKGICVVTIKRRGRPDSVGVNWAGNRRGFSARSGETGLIKDPIGEQEPGKTSFTRAFRRAAKLAYPLWFDKNRRLAGVSEDGVTIGEYKTDTEAVIEQGRQAPKELPAPVVDVQEGLKVNPGSGGAVRTTADLYSDDAEREFDRRIAERE